MTPLRRLGLALAFILAAACDRAPVPPVDEAGARLQAEMERATMDFSRGMVIRMQREGKRLEVASLMPATIAEASVGGQTGKTIFRIDDKGSALVLFSRDLLQGKSLKTEILLAQLNDKRQFSFPVIQSDGRLKEETFVVDQILHLPAN